MEEEKKNNKGLMVGIIIILVICLVAIFYFMFKMTYAGSSKSSNEEKKEETADTAETTQGEFTELTKYELQEGEEKEINVDGKTIKIKVKNGTYYLNNEEVGKEVVKQNKYDIYIANKLIIFSYIVGQSGDKFYIYDIEGKKVNIEDKGGADAQYYNIRLKNNRIFVDTGGFGDCYDENSSCYFFQRMDTLCENEKYKDVKENLEEFEKHKNDNIYTTTYEIKYNGIEISIQKAEDVTTIEQWIQTYDKVCLIEE